MTLVELLVVAILILAFHSGDEEYEFPSIA